jgi:hypothetical protein
LTIAALKRLKRSNIWEQPYHIKILFRKNLKIKMNRTINLPLALYGCITWSRTFRNERRLKMLRNRVLRRIFGPKTDEVAGEWGKLHN